MKDTLLNLASNPSVIRAAKKVLLWAFLLLLFLLPAKKIHAAGTKENYKAAVENYEFEQSQALFPQDEASPSASYTAELALVKNAAKDRNFVYSILYQGLDPKEYAQNQWDEHVKEYLNDAKDLDENSALLNWEWNDSVTLTLTQGPIWVFMRSVYYYVGGAHGMYGANYIVLDLKQQEQITLDDLILPAAYPELSKLLLQNFKSQLELPLEAPLQEGGFFENTVNVSKDFFPSVDGIVFQWDPYEIAPYMMGEQETIISWKDLKPFLSEKGMEIFNYFLQ